jgi:hypothetical protein
MAVRLLNTYPVCYGIQFSFTEFTRQDSGEYSEQHNPMHILILCSYSYGSCYYCPPVRVHDLQMFFLRNFARRLLWSMYIFHFPCPLLEVQYCIVRYRIFWRWQSRLTWRGCILQIMAGILAILIKVSRDVFQFLRLNFWISRSLDAESSVKYSWIRIDSRTFSSHNFFLSVLTFFPLHASLISWSPPPWTPHLPYIEALWNVVNEQLSAKLYRHGN